MVTQITVITVITLIALCIPWWGDGRRAPIYRQPSVSPWRSAAYTSDTFCMAAYLTTTRSTKYSLSVQGFRGMVFLWWIFSLGRYSVGSREAIPLIRTPHISFRSKGRPFFLFLFSWGLFPPFSPTPLVGVGGFDSSEGGKMLLRVPPREELDGVEEEEGLMGLSREASERREYRVSPLTHTYRHTNHHVLHSMIRTQPHTCIHRHI